MSIRLTPEDDLGALLYGVWWTRLANIDQISRAACDVLTRHRSDVLMFVCSSNMPNMPGPSFEDFLEPYSIVAQEWTSLATIGDAAAALTQDALLTGFRRERLLPRQLTRLVEASFERLRKEDLLEASYVDILARNAAVSRLDDNWNSGWITNAENLERLWELSASIPSWISIADLPILFDLVDAVCAEVV